MLTAFEPCSVMPLWGAALADVVNIAMGNPKDAKSRWEAAPQEQAVMSCPGCGSISSLRRMKIDADGLVHPPVRCPHAACSFNRYVKLVGWQSNTGARDEHEDD